MAESSSIFRLETAERDFPIIQYRQHSVNLGTETAFHCVLHIIPFGISGLGVAGKLESLSSSIFITYSEPPMNVACDAMSGRYLEAAVVRPIVQQQLDYPLETSR